MMSESDESKEFDASSTNGDIAAELVGDEKIPRRISREMVSAMMSIQRNEIASPIDKIAEKLNEEHISKMIDNSEKEDKRSYSAFKLNKFVELFIIVIALIFALFLLVFFKDSPHFNTILTGVFSFLGGLGVGRFLKRPSGKD